MSERKFTHPRDAGPDHPGYVTRDGRPARIVCTDAMGDNRPILALVNLPDLREAEMRFFADGSHDREGPLKHPSKYDLLDAPKPKRSGVYERWVIVSSDNEATSYFDEIIWRDNFRSDDLARFVVQHPWEEGEGL